MRQDPSNSQWTPPRPGSQPAPSCPVLGHSYTPPPPPEPEQRLPQGGGWRKRQEELWSARPQPDAHSGPSSRTLHPLCLGPGRQPARASPVLSRRAQHPGSGSGPAGCCIPEGVLGGCAWPLQLSCALPCAASLGCGDSDRQPCPLSATLPGPLPPLRPLPPRPAPAHWACAHAGHLTPWAAPTSLPEGQCCATRELRECP